MPKTPPGRILPVTVALLALGAVALAEVPVAPPGKGPEAAQPAAAGAAGKTLSQKIPATDVTFEMVLIPGGRFKMGSPADEAKRKEHEGPQVEVDVDPFYMGKYEVTQAEYSEFLANYPRLSSKKPAPVPKDKWSDAVSYPTPMYELEAGPVLDRMGRGGSFPAVIMSVFGAKQYTKWLSKKTGRFYRLPTEAEWEYACRAGTNTAYHFGNNPAQLDAFAWYFDNSALSDGDPGYHKVGLKKPNPWGLYDMHGNVAEWVIDQYDKDWYKKHQGKPVKATEAVTWATEQHPRLIRGGGWESDAEDLRSASRLPSSKNLNKRDPQLPQSPYWLTEGFWIGFRVISPLKEPTEAEKLKFWDADDETTKRVLERDREIREMITAPAKAAAADNAGAPAEPGAVGASAKTEGAAKP
jgi:formylglycine-generating enzyme required for sulfatase activity